MRPDVDVAEGFEAVALTGSLSSAYADGSSRGSAREAIPASLAALLAQAKELTAELNRLRGERERWLEQQRQIMQLLSSKGPDRILHDLRNVLNERELFRSLADLGE